MQRTQRIPRRLVGRSNRDAERPLARSGHHLEWIDRRALRAEPQSLETGDGEQRRIETLMPLDLANPRRHIASQGHHLEIGTKEAHLRDAPQTGRPDARPSAKIHQRRAVDERLARIVALWHGAEGEPGRQRGGKVLEGMHRDIDPPIEQCILDFLGEEALPFELVQRAIDFGIASRLDDNDLSPRASPARNQPLLYPLRLPAREIAAAGSDLHANRRTRDSTRPGTVCGSASITSRSPNSRAVAPVIVPIVAATNCPEIAASRPTRSRKYRTVDDDVNVTASMRPTLMSSASPRRSVLAGAVRYSRVDFSPSPVCCYPPAT